MAATGNMVVVLEDDPSVRGALCLLLSDLDYEPAAGASAAEALVAVGSSIDKIMAVITDFDLGAGLNGVDEASVLRAAGVAAPVLVISGSMRGKAGEFARAAGFHFLSKPVKPVDIQDWLTTRAG